MASTRWTTVCQDCGKPSGVTSTVVNTSSPNGPPHNIPGKCPSHVSGKPNMPHRGKWEQIG